MEPLALATEPRYALGMPSRNALAVLDRPLSTLPRFVLLSAFGLGLVVARVASTHSPAYSFLAWNLFLAWIPYTLSRVLVWVRAKNMHSAWVGAVGLAWLLFLPNAPYLVTDVMHLRTAHGAPLWFDAVMLMTFGWTGLALGIESLAIVAKLVAAKAGVAIARTFVVVVALLSGYGIYLGRFVRLNSWDVARHPGWFLREAAEPLVHPLDTMRAWNVTLVVAGLFVLGYATMRRPAVEPAPTDPPG